MSPTVRIAIGGGVLLVLAGVAVWYLSRKDAESVVPDSTESQTPYYDTASNEVVHLSALQIDKFHSTPGMARKVGTPPDKRLVYKNEKTGQFTIVPARKCDNGKWVPLFMPDGRSGPACPEDKAGASTP